VSLATFLHKVVAILDEAGVPYMLTGSLASAFYAVPRSTQDVDVVIATEESGIQRVVRGLQEAGYYADLDAALDAWRTKGQFNAIDPDSGWKVDLIVRKDRAFSRTEFERRERTSMFGIQLSVASPEDVLIAKLEWSRMGDSALQRRDVVQLLERMWLRLDRPYLEKWVAELGLEREWVEVLQQRSGKSDQDES
jgi:hypothetical protein